MKIKAIYLKGPRKGSEKELNESIFKLLSKKGLVKKAPKEAIKEDKSKTETKELKTTSKTKKR